MKKVFSILALLFILSGCGSAPTEEETMSSNQRFVINRTDNGSIDIITDRQTGCKYIMYRKNGYTGSPTTMLDEKGKPICGNIQ